jgi:hypothetical protein
LPRSTAFEHVRRLHEMHGHLTAREWHIVRLPVLTFLVIIEPLVQFLLSAVALLLALTAIFFKLLVHRPDFPFWGMLALSIGCVWALALCYAIIRVLGLRGAVGPRGGKSGSRRASASQMAKTRVC